MNHRDPPRMSQQRRAQLATMAMRIASTRIKIHLNALDNVLGESQNQPPQGGSDGTIPPSDWNNLAKVRDAARDFIHAVNAYFAS